MRLLTDSNSRIVRRAKIFADMYRKHPEWLFTTFQQRFDLLYTGIRILDTWHMVLKYNYQNTKIINKKNTIDIQSKELFWNFYRTSIYFILFCVSWTKRRDTAKSRFQTNPLMTCLKPVLSFCTKKLSLYGCHEK